MFYILHVPSATATAKLVPLQLKSTEKTGIVKLLTVAKGLLKLFLSNNLTSLLPLQPVAIKSPLSLLN